MIFDLLKKKKFDELYKYIKENEDLDLDVYDENFNYFIQYLVIFNNVDIVEYILKNRTIRLDILDSDGRSLLYNTIKYNYIDLLTLFLQNDKNTIGISIYDVTDKNGYTGIHYAIMFNNINAFNKLYGISSININSNIYDFAIEYNSNLFIHILDSEIRRNHDIKHFINNKGESVLQIALNYEIYNIINYIINNKPFLKQIINNASHEFGLTALHQAIIITQSINNIPIKLINEGADINKGDSMGNTPLHYSVIEKRYDVILELFKHENLNYNETNMNGNTALHLLINEGNININNLDANKNILLKLIENTDLNIINNNRETVLYYIVRLNLWQDDDIKNILMNKPLNIFILNKDNETIYDINNKDNFIDIVVNSYLNTLKKNKDKLVIDWEIKCSKEEKISIKNCKDYIHKLIKQKIKSIPTFNEITLPNIDSGIYMENCYFIGSNIDILFGLLYLYINHKVNLLLEYPLTNNKNQRLEIEKYYTQMGLNYSLKLDFCNIEILWSYMKMIYIKNFDSLIKTKLESLNNGFLIIPLGIDTSNGSHANILIIDIKNKTIERFEPNGKYSPRGFYYNQDLLDNLLKNKFNELLSDYNYYSPSEYLPTIGFQILETIEDKCKKIGDPNGFCAVWCIWWAEQRITNPNIKPSILAEELIKQIKLSNTSFKKIIRNFSIKMVQLRDKYLENINLDIDKWINGDYDEKDIDKLEKNILNII